MPLLEPIMKGLIEWIYEMVVGIMEYAAKELVGVMSMDMAYFEQTAPVIKVLKAKIRSIYFAEHLCLHFYFLHQNRYVILLWV